MAKIEKPKRRPKPKVKAKPKTKPKPKQTRFNSPSSEKKGQERGTRPRTEKRGNGARDELIKIASASISSAWVPICGVFVEKSMERRRKLALSVCNEMVKTILNGQTKDERKRLLPFIVNAYRDSLLVGLGMEPLFVQEEAQDLMVAMDQASGPLHWVMDDLTGATKDKVTGWKMRRGGAKGGIAKRDTRRAKETHALVEQFSVSHPHLSKDRIYHLVAAVVGVSKRTVYRMMKKVMT